MSDKLFVEIGATITSLKATLKDALKEVGGFTDDTKKEFQKAGDGAKSIRGELAKNGKAMATLNEHTKGLGSGWVDVAKASKKGGAAMKTALISSGIGLAIVLLGEMVKLWDDIKGEVNGTNEELRKQVRLHNEITEALDRQGRLQNDNSRVIQNETELAVFKAKMAKASESEIFKIQQDGRNRLLEEAKKRITDLGALVRNGHTLSEEDLKKTLAAEEQARRDSANIQRDITRASQAEQLRILNEPAAPMAVVEQQQWVKDILARSRDEVFTLTEQIQQAMVIRPEVSEEQIAWAENLVWLQDTLQNFADDANAIINGSIAGAFSDLGTVIGEALATGGNVLGAIGESILQSLGQFLGDMGEMLIQYGTMAVMKGTLDNAIAAGSFVAIGAGLAAIGVGIALKAISGAMGTRAKNSTSGGGGGRSSVSAGVGGGSSRVSSGSSVSGSNSSSGGEYVFRIQGTELIGVLQNTLSRNRSLGGAELSFR